MKRTRASALKVSQQGPAIEDGACDIEELIPHPRLKLIFGSRSKKDLERLKHSIKRQGMLDAIDIAPGDAREYRWTILDGFGRYEALVELGVRRVPVRVIERAKTYADQVLHAFAKASHKDLTEEQRFAQEQEVRKSIEEAPPQWRKENGFRGLRIDEIVALQVGDGEHTIRRRKKIYTSKTSTKSLQDALSDGIVSVKAAYELINEAESRFGVGTKAARDAIDETIAEARRVGRKRIGRMPRMPAFEPMLEAARGNKGAFWDDMQARFSAWALSEVEENYWRNSLTAKQILSDFLADLSLNVVEMRRRLKRMEQPLPPAVELAGDARFPLGPVLARLGIEAPRTGKLDVGELKKEIQKAYKRRAREIHPDVNPTDPKAAEKFHELSRDYAKAMDLVEDHKAA